MAAVQPVFASGFVIHVSFRESLFGALALMMLALALVAGTLRRIRRMQERQTKEETYRDLFDLALVGIFRSSIDGERYLAVNRAAARVAGWETPEALVANAKPMDFYPDQSLRLDFVRRLMKNGVVENMPLVVRKPDGGLMETVVSAKIYPDKGYIEGTILDVTRLRQVERDLAESNRFLQTLLDAMPTPFFYKTCDGIYQVVNFTYADAMGMTKEDLVGKDVYALVPKAFADTYTMMDQALFDAAGPAVQRYEYKLPGKDRVPDVIFNKETVLDGDGKVIGLVGVVTDITERKMMEEALRQAEVRYRNIFMNSVEGIFSSTRKGRYLDANPAMAELLGYASPDELIRTVQDIGTECWVEPEKRAQVLAELDRHEVVTGVEVAARRRDGETFWMRLSMRAVRDGSGRMIGTEGVAQDITKSKLSELELALRASTDSLTGLANRARLEQEMERMLHLARRSEKALGLLYIDLDDFKPVNDLHGHAVGDRVLQEVAERIRSRIRASDLAARLGGDEFVILLWGIVNSESLYAIGREIQEALARPMICDGHPCQIGASIGGSFFPAHGSTTADLLRSADMAMYTAKQSGKNTLRIAPVES